MPALTFDFNRMLNEAPPGMWVAFSSDQKSMVCYGPVLHEVLEEARRLGEPDPVIAGTPDFPTNSALWH